MAAPPQPLLPEAGGLPDAVEASRPHAQQSRLRPLRRPHRRHPRRRQDRPALRRVGRPKAPHLHLLRPPHRRDGVAEPRRPPHRDVVDRGPNPSLHHSGRHRLLVQYPRRADRDILPWQGVLREQRGRVRVLGERRRLHHRGVRDSGGA